MRKIRYRVPNISIFAQMVRAAEDARRGFLPKLPPTLSDVQVGRLASRAQWIARRSSDRETLVGYLSEQFKRHEAGLELET